MKLRGVTSEMRVGDLYRDKGNRLLLKEVLYPFPKGTASPRAFVFVRLDHHGTYDELELLSESAYSNLAAGFLGNIYDL